ncbi:hypothetical protein NDU88_007644, partial [Pleurodeles waltl]
RGGGGNAPAAPWAKINTETGTGSGETLKESTERRQESAEKRLQRQERRESSRGAREPQERARDRSGSLRAPREARELSGTWRPPQHHSIETTRDLLCHTGERQRATRRPGYGAAREMGDSHER